MSLGASPDVEVEGALVLLDVVVALVVVGAVVPGPTGPEAVWLEPVEPLVSALSALPTSASPDA